jgi:hypothetical protein
MSRQAQPKVSKLHQKWFQQLPKSYLKAEENFHKLNSPGSDSWAGLSALYTIAMSELSYYSNLEEANEATTIDSYPVITSKSLKSRLLAFASERVDALSYNEIRVLNLLVDNDRKIVAEKLGIKKARLSQIIRSIRDKLEK